MSTPELTRKAKKRAEMTRIKGPGSRESRREKQGEITRNNGEMERIWEKCCHRTQAHTNPYMFLLNRDPLPGPWHLLLNPGITGRRARTLAGKSGRNSQNPRIIRP